MSVEDSVSEASGSAGTGTGSCTGSGGPGVRDPLFDAAGGGGVGGRATGGFFLPQALTIISAIIATAITVRLCFIFSALYLSFSLVPVALLNVRRLSVRSLKASIYCDQFG